jgi:hypothetical protein
MISNPLFNQQNQHMPSTRTSFYLTSFTHVTDGTPVWGGAGLQNSHKIHESRGAQREFLLLPADC